MKNDRERFKLEKRYYKLLNNYLGCVRNGLVNDNERNIMDKEVKKAKRAWDNYL
jgi:hypothetical protein